MATIEILSGDFETETTRIRYSPAGRVHLRLKSIDGPVEDLFLENEVVGVAETGGGPAWSRSVRAGERERRLFVVSLRGGRTFVARGDFDAFVAFECAALPADRRDPLDVASGDKAILARLGAWFGATFVGRLLPGDR